MSEIWTALRFGPDMSVVFDVLDEESGKTREETVPDLCGMFEAGHNSRAQGLVAMLVYEFPWKFRKEDNGHIYLDGPSTSGDPTYHPIDMGG